MPLMRKPDARGGSAALNRQETIDRRTRRACAFAQIQACAGRERHDRFRSRTHSGAAAALPRTQASRRGGRTAASPRRCTSRAARGRRHPPHSRFPTRPPTLEPRSIVEAPPSRVIASRGEDRSRDADRQCRASEDAIVRAGAIAHRCSGARGRVAPGGKAADGSRVAPGDRRCSVARSLTGRPRAALVALEEHRRT